MWTRILCVSAYVLVATGVTFDAKTGELKDVVVKISEKIPAELCNSLIESLKNQLTTMSGSVYTSLDRQIYLSEILVQVPSSWGDSDCKENIRQIYQKKKPDMLVVEDYGGRRPHLQRSLGCGQPGDKIYLPVSYLAENSTGLLSSLWINLRYGVFGELEDSIDPTSTHFSHCRGASAREVIFQHSDFSGSRSKVSFSTPRFSLVRSVEPKILILLENSVEMNQNEQWDYIRTACKKFILHDLPASTELGLILFNEEAAHISYPVSRLGKRMISGARNGLAFSIPTKHSLSPRPGGCLSCAVNKAIEALQTSRSSKGGVLVVITKGRAMPSEARVQLRNICTKHQLQVNSIAIPEVPVVHPILPLDQLAFHTSAKSFLVGSQSDSHVYMELVDALRVIQADTVPHSKNLIYEKQFPSGHVDQVVEQGTFVVDKFANSDTEFNVFFPRTTESYIKSLGIVDRRLNKYTTVMDTTQSLHYYSLYKVPFDSVENIGMRWNYSLERLSSQSRDNQHVVQVVSASAPNRRSISLTLRTNQDELAASVSPTRPLILYAHVQVDSLPVLNARVEALVTGVNKAGLPVGSSRLVLLDSGSGDPDILIGDGVYSRYLTNILEEGRYTVTVQVTSSLDTPAVTKKTSETLESLGEFSRVSKGFCFHVASLQKTNSDFSPPSRILDLSVQILTSSQQLEFSWTAPGDDYDAGKVSSYKLFCTDDPNRLYSGGEQQLVTSFSGNVAAGRVEKHIINVHEFNKNLFYTVVGVDDQGNTGQLSNVVRVYMPQAYQFHAKDQLTDGQEAFNDGLHNPFQVIKEPKKIILYVVVGIVIVVVFTFLLVTLLLIVPRKLSRSSTDQQIIQETILKNHDMMKSSVVELNVHGPKENYISSNLDLYNEVLPSSTYSSLDELHPVDHHVDTMETFRDPAYTPQQFNNSPLPNNLLASHQFNNSPIYSKPLPKSQRTQSPVKSILKKPRGEADGESETNIYVSRWSYVPASDNPDSADVPNLDVTQHGGGALRETTDHKPDLVQNSCVLIQNSTRV